MSQSDDSISSLTEEDLKAVHDISFEPIREFQEISGDDVEIIPNALFFKEDVDTTHLALISSLKYIAEILFGTSNDAEQFLNILISQLKKRQILPEVFKCNFEFNHSYATFRLLMRALVNTVNPQLTEKIFKDKKNNTAPDQVSLVPKIKFSKMTNLFDPPSFYNLHFTQISCLGSGGFGRVFLTENKLDQGRYAVKLIQKSKEDVHFLVREVVVLAKLTHSNVVRYYSSWVELYLDESAESNPDENSSRSSSFVLFQRSGDEPEYEQWSSSSDDTKNSFSRAPVWTLFIQMELCSDTLKNWLEIRNSLAISYSEYERYNVVDDSDSFAITLQLVQGLQYLHSMGVVHRDIKPGNIFLNTENLSVKIGDFGLARPLQSPNLDLSDSEFVLLSKGVGTRLYVAPEVVKSTNYDHKCDIFSLGVVLYELYSVYITNSDRAKCVRYLRSKGPCMNFTRRWPRQSLLIRQMVSQDPVGRPSADDLLNDLNTGEEMGKLHVEVENLKRLLAESESRLEIKDKIIIELKNLLNKSD